ncbi:MAG: bifunctional glutamate N-acetyltransferase/amino-acid acetyltransferase ArgJ [Deltaproteobacteria bacterium]|jgi:glutamate N-acetyltransferase/amino-acid N-acetyltransferase|nr:bifunctional glutamate N-acetyltransferase/amino-acid acetyltransferase ArgJ [Deltaproteobacteria bacterium]
MAPKGFRAAAVAAEMRYKGRPDLGLIVCDQFQASAAVFTANVCQAAPVLWSKPRAAAGRAVLVNAGQANAQTGAEGLEVCRQSAEAAGRRLQLPAEQVLLASTGVIGQPVNLQALLGSLDSLTAALSPDGLGDFAQAIMTTDTFAKTAEAEAALPAGPTASVWGAAKGSGMIAPNLATMLAFVLTDAAVEPALLRRLLLEGAEATFNRVTVDGDTSTNDSLFVFASGACGAPLVTDGPAAESFQRALRAVMDSLSRQLARDGEGATRLVEVAVRGAQNTGEARQAARTVAESPLVKTAFFGRDANWGRVLAALGRSGARFDPYQVDLDLDEVPWVRGGRDNGREAEATAVMNRREYRLSIDLKAGEASYVMLTCDFSHDYVSINGSYRS